MRWKTVRQRDAMQCGIACLAMVCRHHGLNITLERLEEMCPSSKEGVSMLAISETADALGLDNASARTALSRLGVAPLPCILHWNQNHFVVLRRISRDGRRYHIADPGKGERAYTRDEFVRAWCPDPSDDDPRGIAMFLKPRPDMNTQTGDDNRYDNPYRFIIKHMHRYRHYFIHIFAGLLLGCVLQLIMPFMTQAIVDTGIHNKDIGFIWLVLAGELMIVAGQTVTNLIRRWLLLHISMRINISLVSDFLIKLLRLPMSFFDTKMLGDLMQRIGDHSRVQSFLTNQVLGILFTLLSFIIFGVVLAIYNLTIFAVFIAGSTLYGLWIARFLNKRRQIDYDMFEQQSKNRNRVFRFINAIQEIKLQDCERRRRWEWEETQADLFDVQIKSLRLQQSQESVSTLINEVKNIVITVFAATAVINGQMTLGGMLAVQYIIGQLNAPVEQLMSFIYTLQDVRISLERINEIHARDDEQLTRGKLTSFAGPKSISIDNIDFKYDPHAINKTLDGISMTLPQGKVTAIVGPSGCGKTTLIKLMLGYYRVTSGRISIGDRDINDYSLRWWRRQCGVVMQDCVIFSDTIERNIAADDNDVDTDRVRLAARIACIDGYITSLPNGYRTMIGDDGVGLSHGQKQRILIARAVYRDPDFIFLDEATNALDANNEREIVGNLNGFFAGRTVVIVAHRLSTVRNADHIIVMDRGRICETGNHQTLTARKGAYYNLVRNQLELGS